ncbi:norbelladine synthase-like [Impatiens glandulifera]|uniref:norbelladine synthase-like n=1 Tax=Impatiens glandulifera TaxID=253017 RepID=UPI001FB0D765|nr:norbelladine synthase-like [Impatiens glandulifera]
MIGTVSEELEVNVSASKAWEVYSSLKLAKITEEKLKSLIDRLEIEGDGGVGTLIKIVFPSGGAVGFNSYTEKFTKIDHEKRVKETEVVEGGYLDLGFNLFRVRFEVIDKEDASPSPPSSCITRCTIEYEIKEEFAANASFVSIQTLVVVMNAAADFLIAK